MKINKVHKERILMNMIGYALTMAKKFYDKNTYDNESCYLYRRKSNN